MGAHEGQEATWAEKFIIFIFKYRIFGSVIYLYSILLDQPYATTILLAKFCL